MVPTDQRHVRITTTVAVLDLALLQPDTEQQCPAQTAQDPQPTPPDTDGLAVAVQPVSTAMKKEHVLVHGRWGMLAALHVLLDIVFCLECTSPLSTGLRWVHQWLRKKLQY